MKKSISPPLSDLQKWMKKVITHPDGVHHALFHAKSPAFRKKRAVIGETENFSRQARLSVYGNAYFSRIIETLESNFESLKNAMGEKEFDAFAKAYLVKYPSKYKSIDDIGAEIPRMIKTHPMMKEKPWLGDLAAVEWAAHTAFYAENKVPLNPKTLDLLAGEEAANLIFKVDPSVRLIKTRYPVDILWRENGEMTDAIRKDFKQGRYTLLVYRNPLKQTRVGRLSPSAERVFLRLKKGQPLALALSNLSPRKAPDVQAWFKDWFTRGLFTE